MEGRRRDGLISAAVDTLPLGPQRQEVLLYRPAVVTRKSSLSSTPHAPRHKKETAFIRALQQRPRAQKQQQLHVSKNLDRHDQFKSWSTSMLPNTTTKVQGLCMPHQAWVTVGNSSSAKTGDKIEVHTKRVRPFRRTVKPLAPEGVPVLDLSCFNEPDHLMPPVDLLPSSHRPRDTVRSDLSWGTAQVPSVLSVHSLTEEDNESRVATICGEDVDKKDESTTKQLSPQNHPLPLQASKLDYIENKVLSHERGKSEEKLTSSKAPIQPGMGDHGLIRRLRFGARILSQNGRDVHRELCGFMFFSDESMTIYEFRQFGQRLSALPLIPRAVYHHPVGRRNGEKYELRQIKKGTTLFFDTSRLTSLPESLIQRPFLAVRITDVDETAKWNLITEGLKPTEYQCVRNYLSQSPSEESKRNSAMFQTLQGMLRTRLHGRACKTLVGLGRLLRSMAAGVGIISRVQLQQALRAFHISLTPEDYSQLWRLLSDDGRYTDHEMDTSECSSETRGGVYCDQVIAGLLGEMSEDRKFFVRKTFTKLDPSKSGSIQITNIHKYFIPSCHPDVLAGKMTPEEAHFALLACLQPPSTQPSLRTETSTVPYADFDNYYEGVSMETVSDHDFIHLLQQCWSV